MIRFKTITLAGLILSAGLLVSPPRASAQGAITGMKFVGTENLQGYGRLEFRLGQVGDNGWGNVTMIDAAGRTNGHFYWDHSRDVVTFKFGGVVYTGNVSHRDASTNSTVRHVTTISGTARQSNGSWRFSVSNTFTRPNY